MKFDHSVTWMSKYPADKVPVVYDFTNDTSGSVLASCTASIYDSSGNNKTASMISSTTPSSTNVTFLLFSGTGGETYDIKMVGRVTANKVYTNYMACEVFNSLQLNTKLGDSKQNSYVTLKEANDYIRNKYGHSNTWDTLSEEGKKRVLIEAANDLEMYNYIGAKYYENQGLQFPRSTHDVIKGSCATPSTTTTFRNTSLYSSTYNKYPQNYWANAVVHFNVGSNIRETRVVSQSNAVNGSITLASPVTYAPKTTDTFIIFAPLDKEIKDAQCEVALNLVGNSGMADLKNYKDSGIKDVTIGDTRYTFTDGTGYTGPAAIPTKARALLARWIRRDFRIGRA